MNDAIETVRVWLEHGRRSFRGTIPAEALDKVLQTISDLQSEINALRREERFQRWRGDDHFRSARDLATRVARTDPALHGKGKASKPVRNFQNAFTQAYADAGHDVESLFDPEGNNTCSRCGAAQIDLSEDRVFGPMRRCSPKQEFGS